MGFSGHSQVRQLERKEELKAYPPDDGRFVKRGTSVKNWPVFSDQEVSTAQNDDSETRLTISSSVF